MRAEHCPDGRCKLTTLWNCYEMPERAPLAPSRKQNCLVFGVEQTQGTISDPLPHEMKEKRLGTFVQGGPFGHSCTQFIFRFRDKLWRLHGYPNKPIVTTLPTLGTRLLPRAPSSRPHLPLRWLPALASSPGHTARAGLQASGSLTSSLFYRENGACTFTTWVH